MTIDHSENSSSKENDGSPTPTGASPSDSRDARRRVLKTGLAALPAIFTLGNRVVLGNTEYTIEDAGGKPSGGVVSAWYYTSGGTHVEDTPDAIRKAIEDGVLEPEEEGVPSAAGYGDLSD